MARTVYFLTGYIEDNKVTPIVVFNKSYCALSLHSSIVTLLGVF